MRLKRRELIDQPLDRIWRELAEVALQTQWQPIETALKDTPILVLSKGNTQFVAYYDNRMSRWYCEIEEELAYIGDSLICPTPTHWMPLPEPPKE